MRAILCKEYGPAEKLVIEDIESPEPTGSQVKVKVKAAGLNFPDTLIIEGKYQIKPEMPFSPGGEMAGEVLAVGDKVTRFKVGDRVIGMTGYGAFAEEMLVEENRLLPLAEGMSDEEGAAFTMVYGTSYHALKQRANIQPGETLLVLGASGGVGLAAVELGKAMGAQAKAKMKAAAKVNKGMKAAGDKAKGAATGAANGATGAGAGAASGCAGASRLARMMTMGSLGALTNTPRWAPCGAATI